MTRFVDNLTMRITPLIPQAIVPPLLADTEEARLHVEHWLHEAAQVTDTQRGLDRLSRFILASHATQDADSLILTVAEEAFQELDGAADMDRSELHETLSFLTFDWVQAYVPQLAGSRQALQLLDMQYPIKPKDVAAQIIYDHASFESFRALLGFCSSESANRLDDIDGIMERTIRYPETFSAELTRSILVGLYDPCSKEGRIISGLSRQDIDSNQTYPNRLLEFLHRSSREFEGIEQLQVLVVGGMGSASSSDEISWMRNLIERSLRVLFQPEQLEIKWLTADEIGTVVLDTVQGQLRMSSVAAAHGVK